MKGCIKYFWSNYNIIRIFFIFLSLLIYFYTFSLILVFIIIALNEFTYLESRKNLKKLSHDFLEIFILLNILITVLYLLHFYYEYQYYRDLCDIFYRSYYIYCMLNVVFFVKFRSLFKFVLKSVVGFLFWSLIMLLGGGVFFFMFISVFYVSFVDHYLIFFGFGLIFIFMIPLIISRMQVLSK